MLNEEPASNRARRERSTRYPGVPLSDCVELAKFIESRGLDGLTAGDVAQALGYKNIKTNTFSARLSAARQFGLLHLENEGYHLTALAKSILHPIDPAEIAKIYRQALIVPPIYAELVERLAEKRVPDVEILGNILYHNHNIIATAKESAAEAFVASAKFAGALGDDGILRLNPAAPATSPVEKPQTSRKTERSVPKSRSEVRFDLQLWGEDSGKVICVRAPETITPASFDRLLQALKLHMRIEDLPADS